MGKITRNKFQILGGAYIEQPSVDEEPLVQPKMFEVVKEEIILQKPKQEPSTVQESGYTMPEMTW